MRRAISGINGGADARGRLMTVAKRVLVTLILFLAASSALAGPPERPERIISLAPSVTELLYALGLDDRVAGVTVFCDQPPAAKEKPKIGGMSNPSLEAVAVLRPDIVVMTTDGNPKEFEERLRFLGMKTYVMEERRVDELPQAIRNLGAALDVRERAENLASEIERKLESFKRAKAPRGRALFVVWPEPLLVAGPGTAIDDAFSILGFENIAASAGTAYPRFSVEEALMLMPEYIFIGAGMRQGDAAEFSESLLSKMRRSPAVRDGRVFFVSDSLYRLGPRVVTGIEEIKRLVEGGHE